VVCEEGSATAIEGSLATDVVIGAAASDYQREIQEFLHRHP
jgi:hypothetical protein